jgi:hypothetical protein
VGEVQTGQKMAGATPSWSPSEALYLET